MTLCQNTRGNTPPHPLYPSPFIWAGPKHREGSIHHWDRKSTFGTGNPLFCPEIHFYLARAQTTGGVSHWRVITLAGHPTSGSSLSGVVNGSHGTKSVKKGGTVVKPLYKPGGKVKTVGPRSLRVHGVTVSRCHGVGMSACHDVGVSRCRRVRNLRKVIKCHKFRNTHETPRVPDPFLSLMTHG